MFRIRPLTLLVALVAISPVLTLGTELEEDYISRPGWCPGLPGPSIQAEHMQWHTIVWPIGTSGKEFVEFHDEFLAQSDDFRLYGFDTPGVDVDPDPAAVAIVAVPGSLLKYGHTNLNGYIRPAGHDVTAVDGRQQVWTARTANLQLGNALFHGYTANGIGAAMDGMFHGAGHMTIAMHDRNPAPGDMGNPTDATRDGAFFQWHKNIDNIYHEWAVGQYQLINKTGTPVYFNVAGTALGAAGSKVNERRKANVYQGANPPAANQWGAIPRIASDIYVGDINNSNLLYAYGIRLWDDAALRAWDMDAFTVLNPAPNGWYFSVTIGSQGAVGTAVRAQPAAARGGCIFQSAGGGVNALYRTGTQLGLLAANSDNLKDFEVDQQKRVQATNDSNLAGIYDRPKQWFSLRNASINGLQALGGAPVGPCDVLRFNASGDLVIAASAAVLGLGAAGNELDAMVIVDTAPLDTLNGTDRIYYSLAAGSPALGANSPADILCVTVAGAACGTLGGRLEVTAAGLGLLATDDIDGLDVLTNPTGTGACCHAGGTCAQVPQSNCTAPGDVFLGPETVCSATQCPSSGACCQVDGTCTVTSSTACLTSGGTFRGSGTICPPAGGCPKQPGNDECTYGYQIPYNYSDYSSPDGYYSPYGDNTYGTTRYPDEYQYPGPTYPYDPPYSCADHETFFPPYGSGTTWYYYDVPTPPPGQPTRSIGLYTQQTYDRYQQSYDNGYNGYGYAYDTRLGIYYSPGGDCSNLQEVSCGDNYYSSYGPAFPPYRGDGYVEYYNPPPGRYYIQLASVGNVNRGAVRLQVRDPQEPPVQSDCCYHGQCISGLQPDTCRQAGGIPVSHCDPSLPCDSQIPPAQDCFHTQCGKTFYDFANTPIPCGFFDPGSQPFDSKVLLGGGSTDGVDTRMNRLNLMTFPTFPMTANTPIELVSLSLQSCQPITVRYCTGIPDQQWNLSVTLSSVGPPPPPGNMTVTKTYPNGGTFSSHFLVQPVFTFKRISDGLVRVLDTGLMGMPFVMLDSTEQSPWVHQASIPIQPDCGSVNFIPGVQGPGGGGPACTSTTECCTEVGHEGPGHLHVTSKTCTPCPCGACCNSSSGACTLVTSADPAATCAASGGQFKGIGTTCKDSDGDSIPDAYETNNCCSAGNCGTKTLCSSPTDPTRADTDGDGLPDNVDPFPCNRCLPNGLIGGPAGPNRPTICDKYDTILPGDGDCDNDGICDLCEIKAGTSHDCNNNGVPDECEPDCNNNGVPDDYDISCGTSLDTNGDHIPDECCLSNNNPFADFDGDGDVDMNDFSAFQRCYTGLSGILTAGCGCFDRNGDGHIAQTDFDAFRLCQSRSGVLANTNCDGPP